MRICIALTCTLLAACGFEGQGSGSTGGDDQPGSTGCASGDPDFDGDGVPDACDLCPHLAVIENDTDGDRVGNECDPNPETATEHRAIWETFDAPLDGWTVVGGWSFDGGVAHHDSIDNELDYITHPMTFGKAYAATRVRVEQFDRQSSDFPSLGVSTGGIPPKTQYYSCAAGYFFGERLYIASKWPGVDEDLESTSWGAPFTTVELTQHVSDQTSHCFGHDDNVGQRGVTTAIGDTTGKVSLYAIDARGDFEYLFVVSIE